MGNDDSTEKHDYYIIALAIPPVRFVRCYCFFFSCFIHSLSISIRICVGAETQYLNKRTVDSFIYSVAAMVGSFGRMYKEEKNIKIEWWPSSLVLLPSDYFYVIIILCIYLILILRLYTCFWCCGDDAQELPFYIYYHHGSPASLVAQKSWQRDKSQTCQTKKNTDRMKGS